MKVRVVLPPDEFITAADLGLANDAATNAAVQSAVQYLDGPAGYLGMSLGVQTLEATGTGWYYVYYEPVQLPLGPIIRIESLTYLDQVGDEQTIDETDYRLVNNILWFGSTWSPPSHYVAPDAVRIRYVAGWDEDTTGVIPQPILQAIGLDASAAANVQALAAAGGSVKSVEIPGVMTKTYNVASPTAGTSDVRSSEAYRNLLAGYRQRKFI